MISIQEFHVNPPPPQQNHNCQPRFISEVGAAHQFFLGQASAAADRGFPIQWCFSTPYLVMWTLNAPAVTNFRVSYDYYYGGSWNIGTSSMIVWAMGGAPSKDTFWTTDNGNQSTSRDACDKTGCPLDHSTPAAELHTMLTTLSTGPVGFSDAPGETDAVLLARTCDSKGNLLQPSRPIIAVDSTHDVAIGASPSGYVLGTHTDVAGVPALWILLAHQLTKTFVPRALDVWPRLVPGAAHVSADLRLLRACAALGVTNATAATCGVAAFNAPTDVHDALPLNFPPTPNNTDPFTPIVTILVPVQSSTFNIALLGEPEKITPISVQRFTNIACVAQQLSFTVSGQEGETTRFAALSGGSILFGDVTFSATRTSTCLVNTAGIVCA